MTSRIKSFFRFRGIVLSSILVFSTIATFFIFPNVFNNGTSASSEEPYFGISFNGATVAEAKMLIEKTKNYTNLFVLQSGPISKNETAINIICDYAVEADLEFIVFFGWFDYDHEWQIPWLDFAKERWGEKFLGVYLYDEPGRIQVDYNWSRVFHRIQERFPEFYESISVYIQNDSKQLVARDYEEAYNRYFAVVQLLDFEQVQALHLNQYDNHRRPANPLKYYHNNCLFLLFFLEWQGLSSCQEKDLPTGT